MAKVLIVEDEITIAAVLAEFLEEEGFPTTTAPNGREAVTFLKAEQGYIVLLDVMLPFLDGYGVIEWLRAAHHLDHHQIILMSAGSQQAKARALVREGAIAAFINKPFDLEQILKLVKQVDDEAKRVGG